MALALQNTLVFNAVYITINRTSKYFIAKSVRFVELEEHKTFNTAIIVKGVFTKKLRPIINVYQAPLSKTVQYVSENNIFHEIRV